MRHAARRVYYPHRLGMDHEDVVADLQLALVKAIRRHRWNHSELLPDPLVRTIVKRRVSVLIRNTVAKYRESLYHCSLPVNEEGDQLQPEQLVADDAPSQEDQFAQDELQAVCQALQYALQRNMSPAVFAVLHLRCVEELTPTQIAELSKLRSWQQVSDKIGWAKVRAQAFLRTLGISSWEELAEINVNEFSHVDLDS